jgi:putative membrane protein
MGPEIVALLMAASVAGALVGTVTGMVPGIHVNTLTSILLAVSGTAETSLAPFLPDACIPLLLSACIMSASVVHSFVDFVPSVFIGAPDADDVMSMLPGHRMLMEGHGMAAVRSAAIGSLVGAVCAVVLAVPFQIVLSSGLGGYLDSIILGVSIAVSAVLIIREDGLKGRIWGLSVFLLSGVLGIAATSEMMPGGAEMLFPLLTGLFGMPALLRSAGNGSMPPQTDDGSHPVGPWPGIKGMISGCLAGWFPGITATVGAVLSSEVSKEDRPEGFISLVASIGTATSVMSLVTLSVSGSGRSGATQAIREIMGDGLSGICSPEFIGLLMCVAAAALMGYIITIRCGSIMCTLVGRFDPGRMSVAVAVLIVVLVLLMCGPMGLLILFAATLLGSVPPSVGTGRVTLVGCLLVPSIAAGLGLVSV